MTKEILQRALELACARLNGGDYNKECFKAFVNQAQEELAIAANNQGVKDFLEGVRVVLVLVGVFVITVCAGTWAVVFLFSLFVKYCLSI